MSDETKWEDSPGMREVSEEFIEELKRNGADPEMIYNIRKDNQWKRMAKSVIKDLQQD